MGRRLKLGAVGSEEGRGGWSRGQGRDGAKEGQGKDGGLWPPC